jgi:threonine aldolase
MYEALVSAELGDDVLGHDPTVRRLERLASEILAKEDALFFPSGTMANQAAIAAQTRPGDSLLADEDSHILFYEAAGPAVFSGVLTRTFRGSMGRPDALEIESRLFVRSHHTPGTTLVCLENTHNRAGGTVTPAKTLWEVRETADRHGLRVHLDGARLFNAAVALETAPAELARPADTVMVSLSKGLCSPVGSLLCGPAATIEAARYWRKRMGGGMRQAGVLAACGIVSLTEMVERLAEDHARARRLAEELARLPGLKPHRPETNIVMVDTVRPVTDWVEATGVRGVMVSVFGPNRFRLVTHRDVDDAGLETAVRAFAESARELQ